MPGGYDIEPRTACYHVIVRWAAFLLIAVAAIASAAPQVEIKAHTQLALTRVRLREPGVLEVTGRLTDKLTGEGIEGQRVRVAIGDHGEWTNTREDGSFQVELPGDDGPQQVALQFAGSALLDPAAPLDVTTDPTKSQLSLAITKVEDDPAGVKLRVTARSDDGPVEIPVQVMLAPLGSDAFRPLAAQVTAGTPFLVTRKDAGGPGSYRVLASFAGDDSRQPASAEGTIDLAAGTTTTLAVKPTTVAYEDKLAASGKLVDDDGQPVARAAVALLAGDRRLAQGATGKDGTFAFKVEAQILGQGQFTLQAQADPTQTSLKSSHSPPVVVTIRAPQPVPVSYTVAAFLATALAAGGFFAARNRPWLRLRRPVPPAEVPSEGGEADAARGGLVVSKPGIVSTLRRAADDGFAGVVRDTVRGRPIGQAVVRLVCGGVGREVRSSGDGAFVIERLGPGEWRAEVAAPGHVTEHFAVTIPHRGELRGVRIDLVPVRERVFQLYRRAAEPLLPEARLWGVWSPRQVVDHVRAKRPTPALAELTDFVEELYFSPRIASEGVLPGAAERVERAVLERARMR